MGSRRTESTGLEELSLPGPLPSIWGQELSVPGLVDRETQVQSGSLKEPEPGPYS